MAQFDAFFEEVAAENVPETDAGLGNAALVPSIDEPPVIADGAPGKFAGFFSEVQRETDGRLDMALETARQTDPDKFAKAIEVGRAEGLPTNVAMRNLDDLEGQRRRREMRDILQRSPALAHFFAESPLAPAIKMDDLRNLSGVAWAFKSLWAAAEKGVEDVQGNNTGLNQLLGTATKREIDIADADDAQPDRTYAADTWLQQSWTVIGEQLPQMALRLATSMGRGIQGAAVGAVGGMAVGGPAGAVAGAGVGAASGALAGGIETTFKQEAGSAYREFLAVKGVDGQPLDENAARGAAILSGALNASLDTIGVAALGKLIPGLDRVTGGNLIRQQVAKLLRLPVIRSRLAAIGAAGAVGVLGEVTTEGIQEGVPALLGEVAKSLSDGEFERVSAGDIAERMAEGSVESLKAMTILGPLGMGMRIAVDGRGPDKAQRTADILAQVHESAKTSELAKRSPEAARAAVQALAEETGKVFVPADKLVELYQTAGLDPYALESAIPGWSENLQNAAALRADIEIDAGDYYAHIAAQPIGDQVLGIARADARDMNLDDVANLDGFNDAVAAARQAYFDAEAVKDLEADAKIAPDEQVFKDVYDRAIEGAIQPDQARKYAALYQAFFRTLADSTGRDARELFDRYGLRIQRALPEDLRYTPVDQLDIMLNDIRDDRDVQAAKRVERAKGPSLWTFVSRAGGMRDDGGELAARDLPPRLIAKASDLGGEQGRSLDDMALAAWEAGYFPEFQERPSIDDLLSAIDDEARGAKRFSEREAVPANPYDDALSSWSRTLAEAGIDPKLMTNAEIRAEIERLSNEDPDTGALYQFAGKQAQGADMTGFALARIMDARHQDRETIFERTGWFKGVDGKWRFEISDQDAALNFEAFEDQTPPDAGGWTETGPSMKTVAAGRLGGVLQHEKLFAAYPDMRGINVSVTVQEGAGRSGVYSPEFDSIEVIAGNAEDARSVLLHEVAHAIQEREDFGRGGDLSMGETYDGPKVQAQEAELSRLGDLWEQVAARLDKKGNSAEVTANLEESLAQLNRRIEEAQAHLIRLAQEEYYFRLAGETEARNVQKRDRDRREGDEPVEPWWTQDRNDSQQTVIVRSKAHGQAFQAHEPIAVGPREFFQVDRETALTLNAPLELPTAPEFAEAVENTPSARITEDGLEIDLVRYQKHEQEGDRSVRTGVFYLPKGSANLKHYKGVTHYGGKQKVEGTALIRRPLFVKGATGGKAPEAAFAALKGKDALKKLDSDVFSAINQQAWMTKQDPSVFQEVIENLLEENGADRGLAWDIIQHSQKGNLFRYALQENIIAHAVRAAGYDAVVGYSKGKAGTFISEVYDVREASYPMEDGSVTEIHPIFETRELFQDDKSDKRGSIQFGEGRTVINMFEKADLSTFLHETGHFFLEVLRDVAVTSDAPGRVTEDWRVLREHLGIEDDGNISVDAHEKFAKSFEAYLFEGKAPSLDLQGIFSRFASWLKLVYRQISRLGVDVPEPIRDVMDRMLATDAEIDAVRRNAENRPIFATPDQAGMPPAEFATYQALADQAVEQAKRDLELRALAEVRREETRTWKDEKNRVRAEVRAEYAKMPVYQAFHYLRTGAFLDDRASEVDHMRLDRQALVERWGNGVLRQLPRSVPPVYTAKGGVHPDIIADMFGFTSGDHMIQELLATPPMGRAMAAEVDLRMKERHGDLMSNQAQMAEEAVKAVHNDQRGLFLATELRALARRSGKQGAIVPARQARAMARDYIGGKRVAEATRVGQHAAAEMRASREAEVAVLEGRWPDAVEAKRRQLVNHFVTREARIAADDVDAIHRYLSKFTGKRPPGVDPDYMDQIEGLLERYDLRRSVSQRAVGKRKSLAHFVAEQEAAGNVVVIPEQYLLDSRKTHFTDMSVDDLRALNDAVKNVEHLGRLKNKILTKRKQVEFDAVKGELLRGMSKLKQRKKATISPTKWEKTKDFALGMASNLLKIEQIVDWMDKGDINGAARRYIWQPLVDAQSRENDLQVKYTDKMQEAIKGLDETRMQERVVVLELPLVNGKPVSMPRSSIMAVALNMGNASNLDKMRRGENWTDRQIEAITSHLSKEEWDAVQRIWDTVNGLWPEIAALQRRLTGVEPPKVEAAPVETPHGTYAGGYYPLIYDPRRSERASVNAEASADKMWENAYLKPETDRGHTIARVENFARPILFDMSAAANHIQKVIHDLTHREAIRSVYKIVNDNEVQEAISSAFGQAARGEFTKWLQHIANDRNPNNAGATHAQRFITKVRTNTTAFSMGYRPTTALAQLAGLPAAMDFVKGRYLLQALGTFATDPFNGWSQIAARSGEMRHRANNMDRDIRDGLRALVGEAGLMASVKRFAFHLIGYVDRAVSSVAWLGAYNQHLASYPLDEDGAIQAGNRVVSLTQGAGGAKDMSAIQRDKGAMSLLTMFYSYFNVYFNRLWALGRDTTDAVRNSRYEEMPQLLGRLVAHTLIPAVLGEILTFRGPDDDEGYAAWARNKVLAYPFTSLPFVRDLSTALESGYDYSLSPAGRVGQALQRLGDDISKVAGGERVEGRVVFKHAAEGASLALGLPAGWTIQTINNIWLGLERGDLKLADLVVTRKAR